jgi:streptomycin 3"-adenylyltransferase
MGKMSVSKQVNTIGKDFISGLKNILGKKLYGVYIYGAAAFPDALPTGDIDFHVILRNRLTTKERSRLERFHEVLARKHPPLGGAFDGYYILLDDALRKIPPKSQMWKRATDNSWALHREHILSGRRLVLYGPEPKDIYPPATWSEIKKALYSELNYVEKHTKEYPDYCILNLCRLIYSFETRDVVISKSQASDWALKKLPQWKRHIKLARKSYCGRATPEDRQFMLVEIGKFLDFAKKRIEQTFKNTLS